VAVRTRRDDGELVLEVENDLPPEGTPGRPGTGVGMQNTRARLAQLYGDRARLELEVQPGRGALARIVLPWRELDAAPLVQ
jgi:LytS/YehU family sensor histidine kinase